MGVVTITVMETLEDGPLRQIINEIVAANPEVFPPPFNVVVRESTVIDGE